MILIWICKKIKFKQNRKYKTFILFQPRGLEKESPLRGKNLNTF